MKVLVVSATWKEIAPLADYLGHTDTIIPQVGSSISDTFHIDMLATGVGIPATIYHLVKSISENTYDLIINAGIAGTYDEQMPIGSVVSISQEVFADLGILSSSGFSTLDDAGLLLPDDAPFKQGILERPPHLLWDIYVEHLVSAIGATVNKAGDYDHQAEISKNRFSATIETMECAAFFYVCLKKQIPFIALRAISNRVAPREHAGWDIPLAIKNLNDELLKLIHKLNTSLKSIEVNFNKADRL